MILVDFDCMGPAGLGLWEKYLDYLQQINSSGIASLNGAKYRPVSKTAVFDQNTGFAMYEGLCLGPRLSDGSRSMIMISDGDAGAVARLCSLKLVQ